MTKSLVRPPSEYVGNISREAAASFRDLRSALVKSGPLDSTTCELIVVSGFAVQGFEDAFKSHSARLLQSSTPKETIQQAVLVTLGTTAAVFQVARALQWLDETEAEVKAVQA